MGFVIMKRNTLSSYRTLKFLVCVAIPAIVGISACSSNNTKDNTNKDNNQLPTSLVSNPRTAGGMDTVAAAMKPTMDFKDTLHEFGAIHEGEVVEYDFGFTNNGKTPLLITSASGSCGCTVPEYPREAIAPGKDGIMKVKFNSAGKNGHQDKSVTIHTNTVRGIQMLYIKADVNKK